MTLTEQWQKNELPSADENHTWLAYYLKQASGRIHADSYWRGNWGHADRDSIIKVLAPVPSYEEWMRTKCSLDDYKRLSDMRGKIIAKMEESNADTEKHLRQENAQLRKFLEEFNALDVAKENQQLKELLRECQEYIVNTPVYPQGDEWKQKQIHRLLDKIIHAIGEN